MTFRGSSSEWRQALFGDLVARFIDFRGRTPKKLGMDWGGGDIPALSANNVTTGKVDLAKECHLGSEDLYRRWMTSGHAERGDVLLTMEAPLGNVAQVPDDRKYILSQRVILIKAKTELVSADFLKQYMLSDEFQTLLRQHATGTTATGIQRARLVTLPTRVPPLGEQRKIAAILSSVDQTIESTEAVVGQLSVVKKAMMAELLTRGLPGRHKEFKQTEIGEVPEDWAVATVGDVADVSYGLTVNGQRRASATTRPYLTVANVQDEGFDLTTLKAIGVLPGDDERYELRSGDILIVEGNANPDRLGRAFLWQSEKPGALHQNHLIRARTTLSGVEPRWLALSINGGAGRQQILDHAKTSSGLHTINSKVVSGLRVALPSLDEQKAIVNAYAAAEARIEGERFYLFGLRRVKSALMSVLVGGEVRVRPDEGAA
jgi:type I restriction enzyme S subunit